MKYESEVKMGKPPTVKKPDKIVMFVHYQNDDVEMRLPFASWQTAIEYLQKATESRNTFIMSSVYVQSVIKDVLFCNKITL